MTMMPTTRPRFGLGADLQNILLGEQPGRYGNVQVPNPSGMPQPGTPPKKPGFMAPGSKGAMIAGIIGDTLASLSGGQPVFTMNMMQERRRKADAEAQEAQWHRQRQAGREDKQWEWQNKPRDTDIPPILRDAQAWMTMTPEQRAAYEEMQKAREGDPLINMSLPNGQFYSGPRSGLATALAGVGPAAPPRPVGKLTPIDGGPAPAPGTFRP